MLVLVLVRDGKKESEVLKKAWRKTQIFTNNYYYFIIYLKLAATPLEASRYKVYNKGIIQQRGVATL